MLMDQWNPAEGFFQGMPTVSASGNGFGREPDPNALSARLLVSCPESSQGVEPEAKGSSTRKTHKADREKLRRDRLNEQFLDLGSAIDPDRPRNDKATIIADAIQMLKDLTSQVYKLNAEHTSLSDESRELTREKNELREEKAALKSEIDSMNVQYQQRLGCLYPWAAVDPSVIMGGPPTPYPFPIPVPITSGPMPFHSPIPLYPFFQNQSPVAIPSHCASHHPHGSNNPFAEQQSAQHVPPRPPPRSSNSDQHTMCQHESQSRSSDQRCGGPERSADFSDVVTELELKMPGSAAPSSTSKPTVNEQNSPSEGRKGRRPRQVQRKGGENSDGSCSSRCSSPPGLPSISSNSNGGGGSVANS